MDESELALGESSGTPRFRYEETYNAQPRWQRAAVNLAMPLATLLLAIALIGPSAATASFTRGFEQLTVGLFRGQTYRVDAFARLFALISEQKYAVALAAIAAKLAALNLLPLPIFNGGIALCEILGILQRRRLATRLQVIGLMAMLAMFAIWLFALGAYLLTGSTSN
jgi:membrane-associated protease RseP (regulator of RpoE activity)